MGERLENSAVASAICGKLRRRRKSLQRRPENVVSVDRAAGGLVELGERTARRAARSCGLLLLRDGDGGEEGGFRRAADRWGFV